MRDEPMSREELVISAIRGLVILGRTVEQATKELAMNERRKYDEMELQYWGNK